MTGAAFVGTQLQLARLEGTNLSGVDMRSAVMEHAQLTGANANRQMSADKAENGKPRGRRIDMEMG